MLPLTVSYLYFLLVHLLGGVPATPPYLGTLMPPPTISYRRT